MKQSSPTVFATAVVVAFAALASSGGCGGPVKVADPRASLRDPGQSPRVHLGAMAALDADPTDEAYLEALHRMVWFPGFTISVREEALKRLEMHDPEGLHRTIRQYLPRLSAWQWLTRLCEIIADRGWTDLTPALVSSWARPVQAGHDELDRPEYKALARLYGANKVRDVVFDLFVESSRVSDQGLRTRCWELLHRLGGRDMLADYVETGDFAADDLFLQDLHTGATELGIVPSTREEILWIRELCKPEYEVFRSQVRQAMTSSDVRRRERLELRDLPILVSAMLHEPELLALTRAELYDQLSDDLKSRKHYLTTSNFEGVNSGHRQRLFDFRDELTWGDLAAMRIAVRAMSVPQVVEHLFDYAERDMADTGTEYGGVLALDDRGRFEVLEFMPRIRTHDRQFNAPQAMLDAAYDSLFHFHLHAQRYHNEDFAGPGYGDSNYADNLRANCLVFTFVHEKALNVDFYRHGRVVVDLGVITRE